MKKIDIDIEKLINEYLDGKSCRELGWKYGCNAMAIHSKITNAGIKLRNRWEGKTMNLPSTKLSKDEEQIIDGCILGDASISQQHNTACFAITTIHQEFAEHLQNILPFKNCRLRPRKNSTTIINGIQYPCKQAFNLNTKCDHSLNIFRRRWYPNGTKIIPKDLELSPLLVKYWFYGDGSSSFIKYKSVSDAYVRITFCTNGFTVEDCEKLTAQFHSIGLNSASDGGHGAAHSSPPDARCCTQALWHAHPLG